MLKGSWPYAKILISNGHISKFFKISLFGRGRKLLVLRGLRVHTNPCVIFAWAVQRRTEAEQGLSKRLQNASAVCILVREHFCVHVIDVLHELIVVQLWVDHINVVLKEVREVITDAQLNCYLLQVKCVPELISSAPTIWVFFENKAFTDF
jgi:hypothetical protein